MIIMILSTLASAYIAFHVLRMNSSSLKIILAPIKGESFEGMLQQANQSTSINQGLQLMVQIVNSGGKVVCPVSIHNHKKELITDIMNQEEDTLKPIVLKESERYYNTYPLNDEAKKHIIESKKIYVKDTSGKKYFIPQKMWKYLVSVTNNWQKTSGNK